MLRRQGISLTLALGAWLLGCGGVAWAKTAPASPPGSVPCDAQGCRLGVCLTQQALREPATLLATLRVVPWFVDGQSQGFKLFAIKPDSLVAQLGVQNGDVLRSLNGLPVTDPATAQTAWQAAQNSPILRLSFLRQGQTIERTIQLDQRPPRAKECPDTKLASDAASTSPPLRPSPDSSPASEADQTALLRSIRCQGPRCTLPRSTLDKLFADQSLLLRSGRLLPKTREGKVLGFALAGIRPSSLFDRLGLRNGDLILRIADQTLDSPESALAVYATVRSAPQISVEIERGGAKQTRTYVIEGSGS